MSNLKRQILSLSIFTLSLALISSLQQSIANDVTTDPGYKLINLQSARDAGIDGTGWVIASIDSGVQADNPYIKDALLNDGYCFVPPKGCPNGKEEMSGPGASNSAKEADGTWSRNTTHGTATAGVAVGKPNKDSVGGIAPGAKFFAINNMGTNSGGSGSGITNGLRHIYEIRNKYKFASVFISQGGWAPNRNEFNDCSESFKEDNEIVTKLKEAGIAVIVSSGNGSATDGVNSMGCVADAISVGGVNSDGTIHYQSNIGSKVELLSPYCSISSDYPNEYKEFCGTSGSGPIVAATFALMKQANPSLSVEEILGILKRTSTPTSDVIHKQLPVINIEAALTSAICPKITAKIADMNVSSIDANKAEILIDIRGIPDKLSLNIDGEFVKNLSSNTKKFEVTKSLGRDSQNLKIQVLDATGKVTSSKSLTIFYPIDTSKTSCTPNGALTLKESAIHLYNLYWLPKSRVLGISTFRDSNYCLYAELQMSGNPHQALILRNLSDYGIHALKFPTGFDFNGEGVLKLVMVDKSGNYSEPSIFNIQLPYFPTALNAEAEVSFVKGNSLHSNTQKELDQTVQKPILTSFSELQTNKATDEGGNDSLKSKLEDCSLNFPKIEEVRSTNLSGSKFKVEWKVSGSPSFIRVTPENGNPVYLSPTNNSYVLEVLEGKTQRRALIEALDERLVAISRKNVIVSKSNLCTPSSKPSNIRVTPTLSGWSYYPKSGNLLLRTYSSGGGGCLYIEMSDPTTANKVYRLRFLGVQNYSNLIISNPSFIDKNQTIKIKMVHIDSAGNMSPMMVTQFSASILFDILPNGNEEDLGDIYRNDKQVNAAENIILNESLLDQLSTVSIVTTKNKSAQEIEAEILNGAVQANLASSNQYQKLQNEISLLEQDLSLAKNNLTQSLLAQAEQQKKLDDLRMENKNNLSDLELSFKKILENEGKIQEYLLQIKVLQSEITSLVSKREDDAKLIEQFKAANVALQEIVDTQFMKAKELEKSLADMKKKAPTSITCVKGKTIRKVTGVNPKCPSGYLRRNS